MYGRYVIGLVLCPSLGWGQDPQSHLQNVRLLIEQGQCSPEMGKSLLRDRAEADFIDWSFRDLPEVTKASFDSIIGRVSPRDVSPHKTVRPFEIKDGSDLEVRVLPARDRSEDDLVEYRWTHDGRPLRAVTGLNGMKVDFALDELPPCQNRHRDGDCTAAARAWVEKVLKLEGEYSILDHHVRYRVELPWPGELRDGVWFSSAPEQNLMRLRGMPFWHDRVDAFVEDGRLSILIYRKVGSLMGYQDGSKWFPDEFRQTVRERQLHQGVVPEDR